MACSYSVSKVREGVVTPDLGVGSLAAAAAAAGGAGGQWAAGKATFTWRWELPPPSLPPLPPSSSLTNPSLAPQMVASAVKIPG